MTCDHAVASQQLQELLCHKRMPDFPLKGKPRWQVHRVVPDICLINGSKKALSAQHVVAG